jgi:hypothetical protein
MSNSNTTEVTTTAPARAPVTGEIMEGKPNKAWPTDQLEAYVLRAKAETLELGRRTAVAMFRTGQALSYLRDRLTKDKKWVEWQAANDTDRNTANRYINFYEAAKKIGESRLKGMDVASAKRMLGLAAKPSGSKGDGQQQTTPNQHDAPIDITIRHDTPIVRVNAALALMSDLPAVFPPDMSRPELQQLLADLQRRIMQLQRQLDNGPTEGHRPTGSKPTVAAQDLVSLPVQKDMQTVPQSGR